MTNPRVPFEMSSDRPKLSPPDGKPLMVQIIVNVEYWPFDKPMPRKALSTPHGNEPIPDIPNYSWAEYGLRCGMPRLFRLFGDRELPVCVNMNATVIDHYPSVADRMLNANWEFIAHGMFQRILHNEEDEEKTINETIDKMAKFTGIRPRGWMSPGLAQTFDTLDYLMAAGIEYQFDWVLDDLPCWMTTKHGPLICMPYGFELNDDIVFAVEKLSAGEFEIRLEDTLRTFEEEIAEQPRVLTIVCHPHLCAVPHRYPYYARIIDMLLGRDDVKFMTAGEIADWYKAEDPPS